MASGTLRMCSATLIPSLNRNPWHMFYVATNFRRQFKFVVQACSRHTVATVRPAKVTTSHRSGSRPSSRESRRHDDVRSRGDTPFLNASQWNLIDTTDLDPMEDIANRASKYSSRYAAAEATADHIRQLKRNIKYIRFRTIESNYFKKPPSPNLLTWAAKEQIQYLHQTDPQTWTAQTLSDLFPLSEKDIKDIMKSKVRIHRLEDILQHDMTVQKNWSDLMAVLESENDGTKDVYHAFRNSENEIIIKNAAGVDDLPFPVKKMERFNPKGLFSAIVTDCYEAKHQARTKTEEELRNKTEQLCVMLSEVSKIFNKKSQEKITRINFVKSADMKKKLSISEEMSATRHIENLDNINKQRNGQESLHEFISQKYKDNSFAGYSESSGNVRRIAPYKIQVIQNKTNGDSFVSGDCVYDKNGEFLYRIV